MPILKGVLHEKNGEKSGGLCQRCKYGIKRYHLVILCFERNYTLQHPRNKWLFPKRQNNGHNCPNLVFQIEGHTKNKLLLTLWIGHLSKILLTSDWTEFSCQSGWKSRGGGGGRVLNSASSCCSNFMAFTRFSQCGKQMLCDSTAFPKRTKHIMLLYDCGSCSLWCFYSLCHHL